MAILRILINFRNIIIIRIFNNIIMIIIRIFTQDNPSVHFTVMNGILHIELN